MEPLAFVEILDRHGDVLSRHAVHHWPVQLGRSYRADVIVDDPFVAPLHAKIEPAAEHRFRIVDLGSANGLVPSAADQRTDTVEVGPEDAVRLGHTQVRIRSASYEVPPERVLRTLAFHRRPVAFALAAVLAVALFAWDGWIVMNDEDQKSTMFFAALGWIAVVGVWIAVWSFVSHTMQRRPNFSAHGVVACAGVIAITLAETFFDHLSFGLDAGWLEYAGSAVVVAVFAYMLYRHLALNSRARRRTLGLVATGAALAVAGLFIAIEVATESMLEANLRYNSLIKAPAFLFVSGVPADAFMSEAETLKNKVDAMIKTP
ncbi:MAG TPA: FHA domain-containing protein [Burkholderiales bacterium]|nr:FHA domain-containing protein [Burkholderiales bacterium]